MKAEQMFKALGYERWKYVINDNIIRITYRKGKSRITFNSKVKGISSYNGVYLTKDNLPAINQQMKELGWIE